MKAPDTVQPEPAIIDVFSKLPFETRLGPNSDVTAPADATEAMAAAKAHTSPTRRVLAKFMTSPLLPTRIHIVDNCRQLLRHSGIVKVIPAVTKKSGGGCLDDCKVNRQATGYEDRERAPRRTVLAGPSQQLRRLKGA